MSSSQIERKLAAIMFTDIAGYTEQMSKDESVAISLLNKKESVLKPLIKKHNGTYVKNTGDGSLSHFNSAIDAATCAKRLQESIYDDKDLNVRVGVHLGDTIFEKGDIRGDGVNIASRLESMAVEGGVFVSKEVHDQLANQKEFEGVSLGLQSMKGVGRLIEVYGLKGDLLTEPNPSEYQDNKIDKHSDDEVPSIAIIPFRNKGKEDDAFYAYGICADLISDCSSAGLIRVESLDRIEKIENYDKLDITELASKLFVRYISTGTLWKMDDIFQLSLELYDAKLSKVIWSDRWEEKWDNLSSIKINLSDGLLKALDTKPKIEQIVETTNPVAYELYLKAKHKYEKREDIDDIMVAKQLFKKAIALDDKLVMAIVLLGWTYIDSGNFNKALEIYIPALKKADGIGDKRGKGNIINAMGIAYHDKGDINKAFEYYKYALNIGEEIGDKLRVAGSLNNIGWINFSKGDFNKAIDFLERSHTIFQEIDKKDQGQAFDWFYYFKGDIDIALDKFNNTLNIAEKNGNKNEVGEALAGIGIIYFDKGYFKMAKEYLEKSLVIMKEIDRGNKVLLAHTLMLFKCYKKIGIEYDVAEIHKLIKEIKNTEWWFNNLIFEVLEDISYLETAYNQIQKLADNLESDVAAKFLSYPIPKAIVEEWEKLTP